ncbi:hypothetical protein [Infirmifilum sp.]|uniref:hypothetical protein n=1 Tax=Infirmifilum sp. TaxID=2856575 RepID=UPI003D13419F
MEPVSEFAHSRNVKLDPDRILAIYKADDVFYFVYETDKLRFYAPFATPIPSDAEQVESLEVEKVLYYETDDGTRLDEWEPDTKEVTEKFVISPSGYVPDNVLSEPRFSFLNESNAKKLMQMILERLGVKSEVGEGYHSLAGEHRPSLDYSYKIVSVENGSVDIGFSSRGVCSSVWDSVTISCDGKTGVYLMITMYTEARYTDIYAMIPVDPEAVKSLAEKQREEEEAKRRQQEEELKKRLMEQEQEVQRLLEDKESLVKSVASMAPEWADGVLVYSRRVTDGEDTWTATFIYPAKKSMKDKGFYAKKKWREISLDKPHGEAVKRLVKQCAVLFRDGNMEEGVCEEDGDYVVFKK